MPTSTPEIWWAFIVGSIVLLAFGFGFIATILNHQRRLISAQKEKMGVLRRSEQEYGDLFNNVSDIVYVHSLDGIILRINDAMTKLLGYDKEELTGKSLKAVFDKKYHERIDEYLNQLKQKGESTGLMYLTSKEGKEFVFEYRNSVVKKGDEAVAIRGIARNVTERRLAEQALRESEERFRKLINYSPVPVAVHSGGKWVYVNDAARELAGAAEHHEIIGKPLLYFTKASLRREVIKKIRRILAHETEASILEQKILRFDGKELEVEIAAIPIIYDGKPAGQLVIRDITDQRRAQEELARAQRLETAGRLAGQIAHDFNNLLAPMTAYPTLIREDLEAGRSVSKLVDEIESAALKLSEINQQLLTLGRRGHYSLKLIDLNKLIRDLSVLKSFPKELVVDLKLAPDLFLIKGGASQLTRALINLVLNAKEAMQDIGTLRIETENIYLDEPVRGYQTIKRGEYVKVDISDTGIGIDSEIAAKIFDPFFTTKRMDAMRGSGLGLSIVHGVVQDHNGYITFKSEQGQGTTFSLYFPISRDIESASDYAKGIPRGSGERILLVDDDPVQRTVSRQLLQRLGYEVEVAPSGEEAIEYVKQNIADLLVIDMVMDGIDGAETFRQIREFKADQRAIVLSGYAMSRRVEEALQLGAGAFVPKPIRPQLLADVIRRELDKKGN